MRSAPPDTERLSVLPKIRFSCAASSSRLRSVARLLPQFPANPTARQLSVGFSHIVLIVRRMLGLRSRSEIGWFSKSIAFFNFKHSVWRWVLGIESPQHCGWLARVFELFDFSKPVCDRMTCHHVRVLHRFSLSGFVWHRAMVYGWPLLAWFAVSDHFPDRRC